MAFSEYLNFIFVNPNILHMFLTLFLPAMGGISPYTRDRNVWGDRPFYLVKQPQEKWACDFRDDALPLSFQLQVAEVIF